MRQAAQVGKICRTDGRRLSLYVAVLVCLIVVGASPARSQGAQSKQNTTPIPAAPSVAPPPLPPTPASVKTSAAQTQSPPTAIVQPKLPGMPAVQGVEIDRVVAIVNGELILDSDVNQELRFAALLPYGVTSNENSRDAAIDRLVNRDLILQQLQLQPEEEINNAAVDKDLDALRKSIPECKKFHCETQTGWDRFLATQGFNEQSLTNLWRQRMEVLTFIQQRFQMGIRISPEEIQTYYEKTMLPEYAERHVTPPPVQSISERIEEVLLQQQVSKLLGDWLDSLRAQGDVVVLHPGEEAP